MATHFHALLVGIDRYPPRYRSLSGCVNDIDAIEKLLLEPPGIGIPPERIHITRLAALRPGRTSYSTLQASTLPPTKANLVAALRKLAGPEVGPDDRVLIFYSGHGDEKQWTGSLVWHEALIPHNDQDAEYLFDVEINALIAAIAARTEDLTVVFDCCHSGGASRDRVEPQGDVRSLQLDDRSAAPEEGPVPPPDLVDPGPGVAAADKSLGGPLLQAAEPSYLVVAACQPDEKANEGGASIGEITHGVFTHALLGVLAGRDASQLARLRWADIWPDLLARAEARNIRLAQRGQHPWLIGRSERKVFGGPWEKADAGYLITRRRNGDYEVGAGQLMGITKGAEIAVYGPRPLEFPPLGSPEDLPIGRLKIVDAARSTSVGALKGDAFEVEGARGRLVKPGKGQQLRVSLKPADAALEAELSGSDLLEIVDAAHPDAEVEVAAAPGGGWIIGNDVEPVLAVVPPNNIDALVVALEHYTRYNTVLRMARNCSDPELAQSLAVQLLDCNDAAALAALTQEQLADPQLPECARDRDRIYRLAEDARFCVRITNSSAYHLHVTLFDCTSGGLVQYLSDATLRDGATHVMWLDNRLGAAFMAAPDEMPSIPPGAGPREFLTDRLIALGTTRPDADLSSLLVQKTVQEVVDEFVVLKGLKPATPAGPAELWTATVAPVRIVRA